MLNYNTNLKQLTLPEYGRNIQRMVDHCLAIEDREDRTRCAHTIVRAMGNLFPELRQDENRHKLWDHLMIMADFRLDIDFPCEVIQAADLKTMPDVVPYPQSRFNMRQYGILTRRMIDQAADMEDGPARDEAILLLANNMKKQMLAVNPDGVEDSKIFADLAELSRSRILLDKETTRLREYKMELPPAKKKKKKK